MKFIQIWMDLLFKNASMEDWVDLYNVPRNQSSTLRLTDRLSRHSSGSITTPSQQSFMCPHEGGGYFQTLLEQVIQEESMLSRKPTRFKPPARKSSLKRNKAVLEAIRSAAAAAAATAATARHSCTSTDELDEFQQVQELIDCHWRREDECAAMKLVPAPNRVSPAVERLGELLESLDLEWEIVKEGHEPLSLMRRSTSIKTTSREISEKQSLFKQEFRRGERVSTRSSVTLYDRTSPSPHQSLQRSVTVSNQGPRITSRDYYSRKMRTHSLLPDSLVLL
ncbi:hypothetical protein BDR26DRAFT_1007558 [Obelidium mucronatum]|nr:hypothetical protein BDR26DRAFT_1007558 [Obelidium mucronatum]